MAETRPGAPAPAPAKRVRKPRDPNALPSLDAAFKRFEKAQEAVEAAREVVKQVAATQLAKINAATGA